VGWTLLAVVHLVLAGTWVGSMAYSLLVVQPKVMRFFTDDRRREEFFTTLAQGNRWRVIGLISALLLTAVAVIVSAPGAVAVGYAVALVLYAAASAVFVNVSWRHWPARVFAVPSELRGYQRDLRIRAWTMLVLVGVAYAVALSASTGVWE
jgi:hypothetical protein